MNLYSQLLVVIVATACDGSFKVVQQDLDYFEAYIYLELRACSSDSTYSVLVPKADTLTWDGFELGAAYSLALHPMDYAIMNNGDTLYRRNADQPFWFYDDGHKSLRIAGFFHTIASAPHRVTNCP